MMYKYAVMFWNMFLLKKIYTRDIDFSKDLCNYETKMSHYYLTVNIS